MTWVSERLALRELNEEVPGSSRTNLGNELFNILVWVLWVVRVNFVPQVLIIQGFPNLKPRNWCGYLVIYLLLIR